MAEVLDEHSQEKCPPWIKEYSSPDVVVEIVHLHPDKDERWKARKHYSPDTPVVQKLKRIDELDKAGIAVFLWEVDSERRVPLDNRPRILGGGVYRMCVKGRKKVLEKAGIKATIDPNITLYEKDFQREV